MHSQREQSQKTSVASIGWTSDWDLTKSRNLTFILVDLPSQKPISDFRVQEIKVISHSKLQMLSNKSENLIPTPAPVGLWQVCGLTHIGVFVMGKPLSWFGSWGEFILLRWGGGKGLI